MDDKFNQLIVEKVKNGYIVCVQSKEKSSSFLGMSTPVQVTKEHFVAKSVPDVIKLCKEYLPILITTKEALADLEEEEPEGDLDFLDQEEKEETTKE